MEESSGFSSPVRFGLFEVEAQAGELRKQGFKVKLQEQPFQVLLMLLHRPGEVVTRDELKRSLWPAMMLICRGGFESSDQQAARGAGRRRRQAAFHRDLAPARIPVRGAG